MYNHLAGFGVEQGIPAGLTMFCQCHLARHMATCRRKSKARSSCIYESLFRMEFVPRVGVRTSLGLRCSDDLPTLFPSRARGFWRPSRCGRLALPFDLSSVGGYGERSRLGDRTSLSHPPLLLIPSSCTSGLLRFLLLSAW